MVAAPCKAILSFSYISLCIICIYIYIFSRKNCTLEQIVAQISFPSTVFLFYFRSIRHDRKIYFFTTTNKKENSLFLFLLAGSESLLHVNQIFWQKFFLLFFCFFLPYSTQNVSRQLLQCVNAICLRKWELLFRRHISHTIRSSYKAMRMQALYCFNLYTH